MTQQTKRKPARLTNIKLSELSLVDRPANPLATVTLFKRADDNEEPDMQLQKHDMPTGYATLHDAMLAIAKHEKLPLDQAMSAAARRFPALKQKLQREGEEAVDVAKAVNDTLAEAGRPSGEVLKAVNAFDDLVSAIHQRNGGSRHAAMSEARRRHPEEFRAAYGDRS